MGSGPGVSVSTGDAARFSATGDNVSTGFASIDNGSDGFADCITDAAACIANAAAIATVDSGIHATADFCSCVAAARCSAVPCRITRYIADVANADNGGTGFADFCSCVAAAADNEGSAALWSPTAAARCRPAPAAAATRCRPAPAAAAA